MLRAGKEAEKTNLKIASGLMSRHSVPLEQAVERLHDGQIGDIITCWAYREHDPVGFTPKARGRSELEHQIRNYHGFTWVNGSFILDWLIHNLDVCCWCKGDWPVSAQGHGGRQVRTKPDQLFDHYSVEYTFPDGTRMQAQGRHMDNCWGFFGDVIHGTKGSAVLGEGISQPRIFKGHLQESANQIWRYDGPRHNAYQHEHDLLFDAIRKDKPYNETERSVNAAMTGILGRMAAESGQTITWEHIFRAPEIPIDIRQNLRKAAEKKGTEFFYKKLKKIDPDSARRINENDANRIIRALEIYETTGKTITQLWKEDTLEQRNFQTVNIMITEDRNILYNRINNRVDKMIENGLLDEMKGLVNKGYIRTNPGMNTVGYKELFPFLNGEKELIDCIDKIKQNTRNFAKRQLTWYRKIDFDLTLDSKNITFSNVFKEIMIILQEKR